MCCPSVQNSLFLINVYEELLKAEYFKPLKQPGVIFLLFIDHPADLYVTMKIYDLVGFDITQSLICQLFSTKSL